MIAGVARGSGSAGDLSGSEYPDDASSGLSSPNLSAAFSQANSLDPTIGRLVVLVTSATTDTLAL
jgi:hypothetical protein